MYKRYYKVVIHCLASSAISGEASLFWIANGTPYIVGGMFSNSHPFLRFHMHHNMTITASPFYFPSSCWKVNLITLCMSDVLGGANLIVCQLLLVKLRLRKRWVTVSSLCRIKTWWAWRWSSCETAVLKSRLSSAGALWRWWARGSDRRIKTLMSMHMHMHLDQCIADHAIVPCPWSISMDNALKNLMSLTYDCMHVGPESRFSYIACPDHARLFCALDLAAEHAPRSMRWDGLICWYMLDGRADADDAAYPSLVLGHKESQPIEKNILSSFDPIKLAKSTIKI